MRQKASNMRQQASNMRKKASEMRQKALKGVGIVIASANLTPN